MFHCRGLLILTVAAWLAAPGLLAPWDEPSLKGEPNLTKGQKKEFLLKADVIASKKLGFSEVHLWRLTLSDGALNHDAAFRSDKEDYHFKIAAYELAELLGLDDMLPATVERRWEGNLGSVQWWVPGRWWKDTGLKQDARPPNPDSWNKQTHKVRVLDELVHDTDPTMSNVVVTEDWRIYRIDFSNAFGLDPDLQNPNDLVMCDRRLLDKLRQLHYDEVLEKTKPHLNVPEVQAVMKRRDKIVAHFDRLIAQKGETAVLY